MTENRSLPITETDQVGEFIQMIRARPVLIDTDLATLYGVTTKALNQAVQRNIERFPSGFKFQLTEEEKDELVTNCDRFKKLKHSSALQHAARLSLSTATTASWFWMATSFITSVHRLKT